MGLEEVEGESFLLSCGLQHVTSASLGWGGEASVWPGSRIIFSHFFGVWSQLIEPWGAQPESRAWLRLLGEPTLSDVTDDDDDEAAVIHSWSEE